MAWQAPRRKQHHVDPYIVARPGEAMSEHFGRRRDAAQAILVDGEVEIFGPLAPFDLDKGDDAAAPRDQIDLTRRNAQPLAQYPPAVKAQPPGRAAFGAPPARFGLGTLQTLSFSVSARA